MIKKKLGLLAGSVLVASSANAAITLDGNTVAVFSTAGAGSYYQLVPGSTGDSLEAGTGFSVDVSAAAAALVAAATVVPNVVIRSAMSSS